MSTESPIVCNISLCCNNAFHFLNCSPEAEAGYCRANVVSRYAMGWLGRGKSVQIRMTSPDPFSCLPTFKYRIIFLFYKKSMRGENFLKIEISQVISNVTQTFCCLAVISFVIATDVTVSVFFPARIFRWLLVKNITEWLAEANAIGRLKF